MPAYPGCHGKKALKVVVVVKVVVVAVVAVAVAVAVVELVVAVEEMINCLDRYLRLLKVLSVDIYCKTSYKKFPAFMCISALRLPVFVADPSFITLLPVRLQSIALSVSPCLSVSLMYLKNY